MKKNFIISAAVMLFSAVSYAGPVGGKMLFDDVINPGESRTYRMHLKSDEDVTIFAEASWGGDLDCALLNEEGAILAKDADTTNICYIKGRINTAKVYVVRVENNGKYSQFFKLSVE